MKAAIERFQAIQAQLVDSASRLGAEAARTERLLAEMGNLLRGSFRKRGPWSAPTLDVRLCPGVNPRILEKLAARWKKMTPKQRAEMVVAIVGNVRQDARSLPQLATWRKKLPKRKVK